MGFSFFSAFILILMALAPQMAAQGLQFVPVTPCRVADTRNPNGAFGGPVMAAGTSREFPIPQSPCGSGIPSNVAAYSLNVTVVPVAQLGYLTIWPSGQPQPLVSTLNSDGRVKANAAIVPAGSGDRGVNVFVTDSTHVVIDIDGYFVPDGTSSSSLQFYPLAPCRVADTRQTNSFIAANTSQQFPVRSSPCSVPSSALAYSLNFTAVPHGTLGFITVWPTGQSQPLVSTLNSSTGVVTANAAIVPAGAGGDVSVFADDDTDLVIDINGYFAPPGAGGLDLFTVPPCRIRDTRNEGPPFNGTIATNVAASGCMPPNSGARAFALNATAVPPGPLGYLTLWPDGQTQPYVSTLNALDGAVTSNMAIVPAANGSIDAFGNAPTQLVLDISSYFASSPPPPPPPPCTAAPCAFISSAAIGQNLQAPVTVTLSPPASSNTQVTITSSSPSQVLISAQQGSGPSVTVPVSAGTTSFAVYAQGLANSGSTTISASAPGYGTGTGVITLFPSAFVLAGPISVASTLTTGEYGTAQFNVSAARLDASGNFAEVQQVRGGENVPVQVTVANPNLGSVSPARLTFTAGSATLSAGFIAGSTAGSTTLTVNEPAGFSSPAGSANQLPVTVVQAARNPAITTSQYGPDRASANTSETALNVSNVNPQSFGKLFSWQVDGYIFAQPLYVPNLNGKNLVFVATMNNSVYAFDAASSGSTPIWKTSLGPPVSSNTLSCPIFNNGSEGPALGILSTPVIDAGTNTLYAVSSNPGNGGYVMNLYGINILTGAVTQGPVQVAGPTGTTVQRTGLVLANGNIYMSFGSCGNDSGAYHGTVEAFNEATLAQANTGFNDTSSGNGGGIWQSGGAAVVDGSGNLYYNSGNETNGNTSGVQSSSVLKLSGNASLSASFTPSNVSYLNYYDLDISSAGPLQIPGSGLLVSGGKEGVIYLLRESDMSLLQSFQATSVCSTPTSGLCHQIHHLAFWNNMLYVWGGEDMLRAYAYSNGAFNTTPAWTQNITLVDYRWAPLAVSANGADTSTGILWATADTGVVYAFNATTGAQLWSSNQNSARDGLSATAKFVIPTVINGRVYIASNACTPGQTCTGVNQIAVYGLLPPSDFTISATPASQTLTPGGSTTYTATITPVNGFNGTVALNVSAGLPSGVTASFNPSSIVGGAGSTTLTISSSSSAALGSAVLTIQGTSGSLTHTASVTLAVQKASPPDTTAPTWVCCTVLNSNPTDYKLQYTAQDSGGGIASIVVTQAVNATADIPQFTAGTTAPVNFTSTETNGLSSYISFQLKDVAGNVSTIDPWHVKVPTDALQQLLSSGSLIPGLPTMPAPPDLPGIPPGLPLPFTVQTKFISSASGNALTISNGSPGLIVLIIQVNGVPFVAAGLTDGEKRSIDISSALKPGDNNSIAMTPVGLPGSDAFVVLSTGNPPARGPN